MAIRVKDVGASAKKFVANAGRSAGDYTEGVKGAGQEWETNTRAAGQNWADGTQAAITDKRFEKGVAEAGAAKYTTRAGSLGAQRYPTGVAASEQDFARGVAPYLQIIASTDLPPRRPKGDPQNMQRANVLAQRLRAAKVGR